MHRISAIQRSFHFIRAYLMEAQILSDVLLFFGINKMELNVIILSLYCPKIFCVNDIKKIWNKCMPVEKLKGITQVYPVTFELMKKGYFIFVSNKDMELVEGTATYYMLNEEKIIYFIDAFNHIVIREQMILAQKQKMFFYHKNKRAMMDVKNFFKRLKYAKEKKNAVV